MKIYPLIASVWRSAARRPNTRERSVGREQWNKEQEIERAEQMYCQSASLQWHVSARLLEVPNGEK